MAIVSIIQNWSPKVILIVGSPPVRSLANDTPSLLTFDMEIGSKLRTVDNPIWVGVFPPSPCTLLQFDHLEMMHTVYSGPTGGHVLPPVTWMTDYLRFVTISILSS